MPTMAQWGSKKWAVSSKQVVALEGLAFSYEQVADENTSTEDKKTTNERRMGGDPELEGPRHKSELFLSRRKETGAKAPAPKSRGKQHKGGRQGAAASGHSFLHIQGIRSGHHQREGKHHRAECESEHRLEVRQENNQHSGQKGQKENDQSRRLCEADRQQVRNRPEDPKLGKTAKA